MKSCIRILLLLFLTISQCVFAEQLEIKVDQNTVSLPYWPAQKSQHGAVIIVRGGAQPEYSELLVMLTKQLARNGWSVVLLNCDSNNTTPWLNQIPETISSLRQNNNKRIVMIHYGEQLNVSLDYFSKPQSKMINGLVLLSAYGTSTDDKSYSSFRFPIFDVAGQFDYDTVLDQMQFRGKAFKAYAYKAVEMPGADHEYEYVQKLLISYIHGWMVKLPETNIQPRPIPVSYIEPVYLSQSQLIAINNVE
ncbi:alpha/beta hydrolase [uncultured Legionella sp.]|uniref:alpha/beta hydrolase n=1 Tax=uncultured Legionella sp. TaxID=210934 RepID=UPI0026315CAD|nr:alpha/beta hydrolase [uncultured Legionella sp.]